MYTCVLLNLLCVCVCVQVWELIAVKMRQGRKESPPFRWNHVENKWKNMTKKYRDFIDMNRRNGTSFKCRFHDEIAAIYNYNPDEDQKTAAEGLRALKSGPLAGNNGIVLTDCYGTITAGNVSASADSGGAVVTKVEKVSPEEDALNGNGNGSGSGSGSGDALEVMEPLLVKKKKYARLDPPAPGTHASSQVPTPKPILPLPPLPAPGATAAGCEGSTDIAWLLRQLRAERAKQEQERMERLEVMHREKMNMFGQFLDILKESKPP